MGSTAAVDKFVKTVLQVWPPYRWEDSQEENWIDIVAGKIAGFSDQVIERALSEMVGKRGLTKEERRTPTPAECIAACSEAKRWIDVQNGQKVLPTLNAEVDNKYPEHSDARKRQADDLIRGRMGSPHVGQQAAKDHYWIMQLHDFCRQEQRLPNDKEISNLKRKAKDTDDVFARGAGGVGPIAQRALWAIQIVTETRQQLCDLVHGKWERPLP